MTIKLLKSKIELDLKEIAHLSPRGTLNKDLVKVLPSVSLVPIGMDTDRESEGQYSEIFRFGIILFAQVTDSTPLDDKLDDLFEKILNSKFSNTSPLVESLEIKGYQYDDYNSGAKKGVAYVACEIKYN